MEPAMPQKLLVLNGPNLNLLGAREPKVYGSLTLADIEAVCREAAQAAGLDLEFRQSNHEGELVDWIQAARGAAAGIVINPGGYTHTSVAIHDALRLFEGPVVEVHLSNIHQREAFRHHSFVSLVAKGVICGLGGHGYALAVAAVARLLKSET
jgi:3-dehydroquinate dehydratase-2